MKKLSVNTLALGKSDLLSAEERKQLLGGAGSSGCPTGTRSCYCQNPFAIVCVHANMSCANVCLTYAPGFRPPLPLV